MNYVLAENGYIQNEKAKNVIDHERSALQMFCETVKFEWSSMSDEYSSEVNVKFLLAQPA